MQSLLRREGELDAAGACPVRECPFYCPFLVALLMNPGLAVKSSRGVMVFGLLQRKNFRFSSTASSLCFATGVLKKSSASGLNQKRKMKAFTVLSRMAHLK